MEICFNIILNETAFLLFKQNSLREEMKVFLEQTDNIYKR